MDIFARNNTSPLGRLDVRVKMALGFSMSLLVVLAGSLTLLGGLAIAGLLIFVLSYPRRPQRRLAFITCALLVWGMMFSQALFYSRSPRYALIVICEPNWLFTDGLKVYVQGIRHGAIQSLRVVAVMLTGYAVCFSTEPDRFLRGLRAAGVPFSLAFMAVSAVRFIPVVAQEFHTARLAMRLKGYRPFRNGVRDTIASEIAGLRPVLVGAIRRSQQVALSIVTRGFSFGANRTSLHGGPLRARHRCALAGLAMLVIAVAGCKALFWLYQQELYYWAVLRPVYAFTRDWL